jgi:hypothetical protein
MIIIVTIEKMASIMQIIMIEVITPLPQLFLTKFLLIQVFHLAEMK